MYIFHYTYIIKWNTSQQQKNLVIFDNTDGHRLYHAKWNNQQRQMPYDFTYKGNLKKNKINEHT